MPVDPGWSQILEGCLAGEKRSWQDFVDRSSKLIYWAIWRVAENTKLGSKEDFCHETFQDFFVKMSNAAELSRLKQVDNPESYLCVSAAHMAFDHLRRRQRREKITVDLESSSEIPQDHDDPMQQTITSERMKTLNLALADLSPKERACLELCYVEGRSHREISLILGVSQDTVSSIVRRSKEKIRDTMKGRGD